MTRDPRCCSRSAWQEAPIQPVYILIIRRLCMQAEMYIAQLSRPGALTAGGSARCHILPFFVAWQHVLHGLQSASVWRPCWPSHSLRLGRDYT